MRDGVAVHRLFRAAMNGKVGLLIAVQTQGPDADGICPRMFDEPAGDVIGPKRRDPSGLYREQGSRHPAKLERKMTGWQKQIHLQPFKRMRPEP
jgi:hypothetical protein